jgi:hypothetical protein
MKHITPYLIFESSSAAVSSLTPEQTLWLDRCTNNKWELNPATGLVDVYGDFVCGNQGLTDFKGVKFGEVKGFFACPDNKLTSLVGAPHSVVRFFNCRDNQLTSLVGAPQHVGDNFDCSNNQLTSLVGAPQHVGDFYSDGNPVSEWTLKKIYDLMVKGVSYIQAVETLWSDIFLLEDKVLIYRSDFKWVGSEEKRKIEALKRYDRIKDLI